MTSIEQIEALLEAAYIAGYECGHDDTVESNYGHSDERAGDYVEEVMAILNKEVSDGL